MAIRRIDSYVAECDCDRPDCVEHDGRCTAFTEYDGGRITYPSREAAIEDLGPWEWHVDGEHVCCSECKDQCTWCDRYHGEHAEGCDEGEAPE